ncbi:hypothetical protein GGX14DRAFT_562283 [Mycena pura]|uniref:Uncharacterized protein n=1 Tax=Mycena pura TaxID=153505 RepID=A0AAD6VKI8_9AGAR|nr:hypothetical protein GGX14DRAFT_562283 [Mycena pura]
MTPPLAAAATFAKAGSASMNQSRLGLAPAREVRERLLHLDMPPRPDLRPTHSDDAPNGDSALAHARLNLFSTARASSISAWCATRTRFVAESPFVLITMYARVSGLAADGRQTADLGGESASEGARKGGRRVLALPLQSLSKPKRCRAPASIDGNGRSAGGASLTSRPAYSPHLLRIQERHMCPCPYLSSSSA